MIKPEEIQNKAREIGVRDQQIEKDYVLSWILQGISQHDALSKAIVFKGGTVFCKTSRATCRPMIMQDTILSMEKNLR